MRPASRLATALRCRCAVTALLLAGSAGTSPAQQWRIAAGVGLALNAPLPLTIRQDSAATIRLRARFATHAFARPLYYLVRIERVRRERSWGAELVHHKLYLENKPPEVQRFDISHGFNLLSVSYGVERGRGFGRFGLGAVLTHPENVIRGRTLAEPQHLLGGYYFSGPMAQLALGVAGGDRLGAFGETKLVGAHARVPVAGGSSQFWHLSAHAIGGLQGRL